MLPAKCDNVQVKAGDLVLFDTWGGGGWGDPLKRDPTKVLTDIRKGLVSVNGGRRYGVVVKDGVVDNRETASLREVMARERGEIQLFDRGGTLSELKARCLAETGLPAPTTPTWA